MNTITQLIATHMAIAFYVAGFAGMFAHYVKKWTKGEYAGNLWAYLFADNPRASLAAIITYVGAAAAVVATGSIGGMTIAQVIAAGFTTGFAIDSAVNKS